MRLIADTHTHTISSTHAYSTAQEMITAASQKQLYAIALTDHGYNMPGSPGEWFFDCLGAIPEYMYGVRVLKGVEANVSNYAGSLDITENTLKKLEWVVASMHTLTIEGEANMENCTNAWLKIAENPYVRVIGHSGTPCFKYDYQKVIPVFAKNGKLVEINNNTFKSRKDSMKNCVKIAELCKKFGARIIVNSDAHFSTAVGVFDDALAILKEIDFPQELIVNSSVESFKAYLKEQNIQY
ncbi:phosphatase [Oscillospiraceae bacterium LCP25S3_E10]